MRNHRKEDRMESFFLAETTKYLYLLFDTDNFIHNQGSQGTVINTPGGECVIETGGYIFNTEAHPIDPSALYCCHEVPKQKLYDFSQLNLKKDIFKGESIKQVKTNCNVPENMENDNENKDGGNDSGNKLKDVTTESSNSHVLDNNGSSRSKVEKASLKHGNGMSEDIYGKKGLVSNLVGNILVHNAEKIFDPQKMLERLRSEKNYERNSTWKTEYKVLSCKAQPFLQKLSLFGEFFNG